MFYSDLSSILIVVKVLSSLHTLSMCEVVLDYICCQSLKIYYCEFFIYYLYSREIYFGSKGCDTENVFVIWIILSGIL